jgi:uncharacterized membrane protein
VLDKICFYFVLSWFVVGGVGHFAGTEFFVSIVPPYIPQARLMVLISGVFELLGAAGLLYVPTRKAAAFGLFLLTLCVTPANVYMWQHPELFANIPPIVLGIRLLVQVVLLAAIMRVATSVRRSNHLA